MLKLIKTFIAWLKKIFCPSQKELDLVYFLPNEIVLQIRHPEATPEETPGESLDERRKKMQTNILNALQSFLESKSVEGYEQQASMQNLSPDQKWRSELNAPTLNSKFITFPFADESGRVFSLVPVTLKGYDSQNDLKPERAISILREAYAELRQNGPLILGTDISLDGFSPNWLTSDLHHGAATGGPGGRPTRASLLGGDPAFNIVGPIESLISPTALRSTTNTVYVAILDTAPTSHIVGRAEAILGGHPVVQRLFRPGNKLTIHRADPVTLDTLEHYSPALHDYPMPDHGTFIASIIDALAPDAVLHLYEVLNTYGVGSFVSVAEGILDAISNPEILRPLVINCSFMFCLPDGEVGKKLIKDLDVPWDEETGLPNLLTKTIREIFEGINLNGAQINVIASAGNDAPNTRGERPDARYPAAFNGIKGVGALQKPSADGRVLVASYSNLADNPPANGYVAFGGEPGDGQGILGMYIGDFPDGHINNTGWAWWAGTSFAAAIVSGLLAANNGGFPEVAGFVPAPADLTPQGEKIIKVIQIF